MSRFRWSNVPVPEGHVILLILGFLLHWYRPLRLGSASQPGKILGWTLLISGVLLGGWAVAAVREQDLQKPAKVVNTGPYAYSRNPMYLAWHLVYVAAAFLLNTAWLVFLLPGLLMFTQFFVIRKEERQLESQFGQAYKDYSARVRRYL